MTEAQWRNWRWQLRHSLAGMEDLSRLLKIPDPDVRRYAELLNEYPFRVTPYFASLIDWDDSRDPLRRQMLPDVREIADRKAESRDPLEENRNSPVSGLIHRYRNRAVALVSERCAVWCRHCTRKNRLRPAESPTPRELRRMAEYVSRHPSIREVIVSGGDPLLLETEALDRLLRAFRRIRHVEVLRIGTRAPVVLPMRVDAGLAAVLESHRPLWLNTQFNHPREITPESARACERLLKAGIPVSSQTVLLKGVNDTANTLADLFNRLQRIMVRPYYLFHCDPVRGTRHLRADLQHGRAIYKALRASQGGLCLPQYVVDMPGRAGKMPVELLAPARMIHHEPRE
ncbi:MAG: KamA family radical SAM protein [Lentisphaerae bacterium]|nr:KamA family radical SAM protein [Lentisphaerota bacterium]